MSQPAVPRPYPAPESVRTAIVTGGSSGIGRATAAALSRAGWNVTISGRRKDQLEETKQAIQQEEEQHSTAQKGVRSSGRVQLYTGDMTSEEAVVDMFRKTYDEFGQIDLVFVNAGKSAPALPIQQSTLEEWQSVVDVNLTAAWLCAREAFRYMDGSKGVQGGRIVMNGSISAYTPRPMSAAYTSTKHAISGLSKTLALDGRQYNIAVTQIDIGNVSSAMTERMQLGPGVLQANGTQQREPVFDVAHAAQEVVHIASLPLSVNIQNVVIMATNMPSYIGRG